MKLTGLAGVLTGLMLVFQAQAKEGFMTDTLPTAQGDLKITLIGHATLMFAFGGKIIHVDPWQELANYATLPKADLVLVTHEHFDHLDAAAVQQVSKADTVILTTEIAAAQLPGCLIMRNGETRTTNGIRIEAVAAYNLVHLRGKGQPYHPKGQGNGYVLTFADKRVYVAGDTENTPEMKALRNIDCAFLPMNLPYTMTPEMVADAARAFKPKILYPYHFGDTDPAVLVRLLQGTGIDVRVRSMK